MVTHMVTQLSRPAVAQALTARLAARIPKESVATPSAASLAKMAATSFISLSDLKICEFKGQERLNKKCRCRKNIRFK